MGGGQLPRWRETPAEESIAEFLAAVTNHDSAHFEAMFSAAQPSPSFPVITP
jgi:hypothetical protein